MMALALLLCLATQDDAEAKAALDTFKTNYAKAKDAKSHADAVTELARTMHDSVAAKLGSLLTTDAKEVRLAAAGGLATFTKTSELRQSATKALIPALTAGANSREVDVRVAIFAALGALQEESAANTLKSHFDDTDPKIACAAVNAAGALRSKSLIEPLIQQVRECEKTLKGDASGGTGLPAIKGKAPPPAKPSNQSNTDQQKKERANAVLSAAESALTAITQQTLKSADEWERWWTKNRATFNPTK